MFGLIKAITFFSSLVIGFPVLTLNDLLSNNFIALFIIILCLIVIHFDKKKLIFGIIFILFDYLYVYVNNYFQMVKKANHDPNAFGLTGIENSFDYDYVPSIILIVTSLIFITFFILTFLSFFEKKNKISNNVVNKK